MKLKTKFKIISVIVIGLALGVGLFVFIQVQELEKEIEENRVAGEIMKGVFELNLLTSDYLLHPGERNQEQWQSRYQSIEELLQSATFEHYFQKHLEEQIILDNLRQDHGVIQTTFLKLVEKPISPELEERLIAELLVKSQTMLSSTSRLMNVSRLELAATQQSTAVFTMISIAILTLIILSVLVVVVRAILGPVLSLQKGAEIIGTGNLKHRIDIEREDEIGDLAKSFNYMSQKLRKSYSRLEKAKIGLEEKVEERTKQLEEAHKKALALKDEFVFIASHELKAPVTAISGFLEFAQEEVKTPKAKEALSDLDKANQRLLKLVQDLLEVARAEAGRIEIKTSSINITTPTVDVIENLKPLADKKGLKITYSGEKLPEVLADPERVSEVLTNLISNAIKYTEKGTIAISHEIKDTTMVTSVSDTGVGMGKEDLSHLFEKFWRSKEVKQAEGTGLGLFITKQLVGKMGGKIWAESQKGKGSTFSFSLPLAARKGIIKKG